MNDIDQLLYCHQYLGAYLKGLRKAQWKVSLEEMARRIGCSKSYLWDLEDGRCTPSLEMSVRIAKKYKTTIGKMATHLEPKERP